MGGELCSYMYIVLSGSLVYSKYSGILQSFRKIEDRQSRSSKVCIVLTPITPGTDCNTKAVAEQECNPNQAISEAALWTPWLHVGDLAAQRHSNMFKLSPADFVGLIDSYPSVRASFRIHAARFVEVMNAEARHENTLDVHLGVSDMLDSARVFGGRRPQ